MPTLLDTSVQDAMLDYAHGWYTGDMARMRRALHPALAKRALLDGAPEPHEYRADALVERVGKNTPQTYADAPKLARTTVFHINGKTASGMLEMDGWTDYMHLVQVDGAWQIINILWEPKAS